MMIPGYPAVEYSLLYLPGSIDTRGSYVGFLELMLYNWGEHATGI